MLCLCGIIEVKGTKMNKAKTKTQTFYDDLKIGEQIYIVSNGYSLPRTIAPLDPFPRMLDCKIIRKYYIYGKFISLKLKFNRRLFDAQLKMTDISKKYDIARNRVIRRLKDTKIDIMKDLKIVDKLIQRYGNKG